MMDGKAIEKIQSMAVSAMDLKEVDGNKYSVSSLNIVAPPMAKALEVMSLDSIIDMVKACGLVASDWMFHVYSPVRVDLVSKVLDKTRQREMIASADVNEVVNNFRYGDQYTLEKFMIAVQNNFKLTEERQNLIDAVSKVSISDEDGIEDDGFTQTVTAKAGVTLKSKLALPNPISLKPFKTFPEIDMPAQDFIFRVEKGHKTAYFKLFEPESLVWQLECTAKIKEYLKQKSVLDVI